ncbi:unnamed protein product, partial [Eretmochelys imbricata]
DSLGGPGHICHAVPPAGDPQRQGPGSAAEPHHQHALLAISYLGKFKPRLSKEQEAETISPCIASAMIQCPALAKLSGTEVARSSAIRAESLQQLPWDGLDLVLQTFLELHLTTTMLLRLFLHLQPWICSPWAQERSQAVRASAGLFMFYRFKAITKWPIRT